MRILSLVPDPGIPLDGRKGAAVHVLAFAGALERAGHEVRLLAARPGTLCDETRVRAIGDGAARGADRYRAGEAWLDDHAADLARWYRPDVVLERLALFPGAGQRLAERMGAVHLLEVNAPLAEEARRHRGLERADEAAEREERALRQTQGVVVVSRALKARATALRGGASGVLHLPNGVEVARFRAARSQRDAARRQLDLSDAACVVAFVSTLKPWHGVGDLAQAFGSACAAGAPLHLLVIGDGPERAALELGLAAAGLAARVTITGAVDPAQVPALLAAADIGVAPYPPREDFYFSPLKVGEYAAAGLPIVMSALDDLADLVPAGCGAVGVPPGDVPALALALHDLATDSARRRDLGASAGRHAEQNLDWGRRVAEFEGFVARVAGG